MKNLFKYSKLYVQSQNEKYLVEVLNHDVNQGVVKAKYLHGLLVGQEFEASESNFLDIKEFILIDCIECNAQFDIRTHQIEAAKRLLIQNPSRYKFVSVQSTSIANVDIKLEEMY